MAQPPVQPARRGGPERAPLSVDFESVKHHYDLSNRFYGAFLSPDMNYSCGVWLKPHDSLADAQGRKVRISLDKLELQPGDRLLEVGSGWGNFAITAHNEYGADVTGLTLSTNQFNHANQLVTGEEGIRFLLEGWEMHEPEDGKPYDAIASIAAFEQFGPEKWTPFFERSHDLIKPDCLLLLHTIVFTDQPITDPQKQSPFRRYSRWITTEIFPNGFLPTAAQVREHSEGAGFELVRDESGWRLNYARTLDAWVANLTTNREEAIAAAMEAALIDAAKKGTTLTDEEAQRAGQTTYDKYMKYMSESAFWFREGVIDVHQFLFRAIPQ